MKNLNLEDLNVQELDVQELSEQNGGMGYDAGGHGLVMGRAKGDGAFWAGVGQGFYSFFFN